jgi:hypothetical protein
MFANRQGWSHPIGASHPMGEVGYAGYRMAEERGRKMAAEALRLDPAAKARCEGAFGKDYCEKRWPEAYGSPVVRWFQGVFNGKR